MTITGYRQPDDVEYTLTAYRNARKDEARDLAKRIRWANPDLAQQFDLIDVQTRLLPVCTEGWDS